MVVAIFEIFEELFSRLQLLPYRYRCLRQALLKLSKLLSRLCEIGQCERQNNLVPPNELFLHTQKQFSTIQLPHSSKEFIARLLVSNMMNF